MARKRVVKTYSDTSAKGDRTPIEGNRYFVRVELVSVKIEERTDVLGRTTELFFRVGGQGALERARRTPDEGTINVEINEVFKPKDGLTLYTEFVEAKGGKSIEIPFRVIDEDPGINEPLVNTKLSVNLGADKDYLSFREKGVKVKIGISANKTRY